MQLAIFARARGMTLGAKYVDTTKSFQGHAAICTKVPPFEAASEDVPPDDKNSFELRALLRSGSTSQMTGTQRWGPSAITPGMHAAVSSELTNRVNLIEMR